MKTKIIIAILLSCLFVPTVFAEPTYEILRVCNHVDYQSIYGLTADSNYIYAVTTNQLNLTRYNSTMTEWEVLGGGSANATYAEQLKISNNNFYCLSGSPNYYLLKWDYTNSNWLLDSAEISFHKIIVRGTEFFAVNRTNGFLFRQNSSGSWVQISDSGIGVIQQLLLHNSKIFAVTNSGDYYYFQTNDWVLEAELFESTVSPILYYKDNLYHTSQGKLYKYESDSWTLIVDQYGSETFDKVLVYGGSIYGLGGNVGYVLRYQIGYTEWELMANPYGSYLYMIDGIVFREQLYVTFWNSSILGRYTGIDSDIAYNFWFIITGVITFFFVSGFALYGLKGRR